MDIEQPLVIQDARVKPLLAYMWMSSKTSCIPKPKNYSEQTKQYVGRDPEFEAIFDTRAFTGAGPAAVQTTHTSNSQPGGNQVQESPNEATFRVTPTQIHPSTGFRVNDRSTRWRVEFVRIQNPGEPSCEVRSSFHYEPPVFNLTPSDVRRWELARAAMDKYRLTKPDKNLDLVTIKPVAELMDGSSNETPKPWELFGFTLVAASYGGLHALAWNSKFPTKGERKYWRVSVLVIASPAALALILLLLSWVADITIACYRKLAQRFKPNQEPRPDTAAVRRIKGFFLQVLKVLGVVFLVLSPSVFLFIYLPARAYLVCESFRTLFSLPAEAYIATSWPQYLPHIT
jgi:hypothetical protein